MYDRSISPHLIPEPATISGNLVALLPQWRPPLLKVMDLGVSSVWDLWSRSKGSILVLRNHPISEQKSQMRADPIGTARAHVAFWNNYIGELRAYMVAKGWWPGLEKIIILGINEPAVGQASERLAVARYTREGMVAARAVGLRWGAFNFSVWWPRVWDEFSICAAELADHWHVYVGHEYWSLDGPEAVWGNLTGVMLKWPFNQPLFMTGECGIDNVYAHPSKKGWRDYMGDGMNDWLFFNQLKAYDSRMLREAGGRYLGSTPFTFGGNEEHWRSFFIQGSVAGHVAYYMSGRVDGPAPTPAPAPTPSPAPTPTPPPTGGTMRELVNVPSWVAIGDAAVSAGQQYWFLKRLEFQDQNSSGGRHHIYVMDPHDPAQKFQVQNLQNNDSFNIALDKPASEPAGNFPMSGIPNKYLARMLGLPSDVVHGMEMHGNHHVNYLLTFEKRTKSGGTTPPPPPPGAGAVGPLITHAKSKQKMSHNPQAALGKKARAHGYHTLLSDEERHTVEGQSYAVQLVLNASTGAEAVAIARVNDWGQERIGLYKLDGTPIAPLPGVAGTTATIDDKPLRVEVPFISQIGSGAEWLASDCGAACVAMVAWAKANLKRTVNEVARDIERLGHQPNYARIEALLAVLDSYGVRSVYAPRMTWDQVAQALRAGKPIIALANYRRLPYTPFNFDGGHYVIIVELKKRDGQPIVVYMDPYRAQGDGYAGLAWGTYTEFDAAWSNGEWQGKTHFRVPRQGIVVG